MYSTQVIFVIHWQVTASSDFNLKVWNAKTTSETATLRGHMAAVNCVAYSVSFVWFVADRHGSDGCQNGWLRWRFKMMSLNQRYQITCSFDPK